MNTIVTKSKLVGSGCNHVYVTEISLSLCHLKSHDICWNYPPDVNTLVILVDIVGPLPKFPVVGGCIQPSPHVDIDCSQVKPSSLKNFPWLMGVVHS